MKQKLLIIMLILLGAFSVEAQLITFDDQGHTNGASYGNPYSILNNGETFVFTLSGGSPTTHVYRTTDPFCSNTGFNHMTAGVSSQTTWTIETQSGNEINLGTVNFDNYFTCFAFTYNLSIEGFKNGISTGTQTYDVNPGFSNIFNSNSSFDDVDKIVISCTDLSNLGIDNINWTAVTPPCTNPTVPTVTASVSPVCTGNSTTLNIAGTLNDATQWAIYTGSCGGTLVGTTSTSSFVVTPIGSSTTYYVRGEGGCVTPGSCGSITVTVNALDNASFSYSAASYCVNASDPTPTISGLAGGTFASSPAGLSINASTGAIDVSASTPATYTVTYTT
ncbi:hypothetical protein FIA58_020640, partial [Flavobacterium jejuense]|nr:hypothetical protein [Flavobacterium jejuense]